ncbi:MAG TPA: hypothetical protein VKW78_12250 [Terriglobales bacterium]|nr:hypothetical protein [Terriglobales bacterium]
MFLKVRLTNDRRFVFLLACFVCYLSVTASAKNPLSASATVRIIAVLPGWITVNVSRVPITLRFDPEGKNSDSMSVPIEASWNLNPNDVRGVEVFSYFEKSDAAVVGTQGTNVPASQLQGSVGQQAFRPFSEPMGNHAGMTMLRESLSHANAIGHRSLPLTVRVAPSATVPADIYSGILVVEARYF